jgi:hypothetical protein
MSFHYTPDTAALELDKVMQHIEEDKAFYEQRIQQGGLEENRQKGYEKKVARFQSDIITLQAIKRRLELTNDIQMCFIAEDIEKRILAVRKSKLADKFVGIIVYYELVPRWRWNDDGSNIVACVGNVKGWPYGHKEGNEIRGGMTDIGDGRFVVDHPHAGPGCWVLGGEYLPIPVDIEEGKEEAK